jgi:CIC family chloride channel protein
VYPVSIEAPPGEVDASSPPAAAPSVPGHGWRIARLLGLVENVRRREDRLALVLSLLIGALVGLVVVAFILLTGRMAAHMYPAGDDAAWRRILVPTLGALVSGILLYRFFPDARGSGIPQTRAAIFIHDGRISFRTVVGKFVCCATSLASGIALGREGPSVHIGAGISSVIARRLGLSTAQVRWLIPVGASAALAAAFNTPIAAVLFSLEEIIGDMHAPVLGSIVLSSTTSWMVLHLVLGDEPLFHVAGYQLANPSELFAYVVLGVVGGFGSVAFVKLLLGLRKAFARLPRSTVWIQPVAGGLCVGLFGYFVPAVLGVGYDQVDRVLGGSVVLGTAVLLATLKLIATSVCYASGNAGGIFGPSMFIGAMLGAAVGSITHHLFPASTAGPGAYALVGMGTAFAGIIRTPLTSGIMIFEVTRNYTIIVPLMISNLIAFYISQRFQREPIYGALARQDGLHLPAGETRRVARQSRVTAALRPAPPPFPATMSIAEAHRRGADRELGSWPVSDDSGLVGIVRMTEVAAAVLEGRGDEMIGELIADTGVSDLETENEHLPHLHPDEPLSLALSRMGETGHTVLPVVSRANVRKIVGIVTLTDILAVYGVPRTGDTLTPEGGTRASA